MYTALYMMVEVETCMHTQVEIGLRELTKRADRIKMLEQQRDEAQGRIEHMDMQVGTCTCTVCYTHCIHDRWGVSVCRYYIYMYMYTCTCRCGCYCTVVEIVYTT